MFGIIVGTHGIFSKELVKSCEMIMGEQKDVRAVTLVPGEGPDDVVRKYEEAIKDLGNPDRVLFLNDLRGGSPYNAASRIVIGKEKYGIVTGVSLPMLVSIIQEQMIDDGSADINYLIEKAVEGGKEGVVSENYESLNTTDDDDDL